MRELTEKDVLELLRSAVKRAGGQSAFARRKLISRVHLNKVLKGKKGISSSILKSVGIRIAYVQDTLGK
jgi:DNA-binding phage protein